ncbi:tetratricopeptide repeat protein 39B-like isoform X2 [Maniola hyperantus]
MHVDLNDPVDDRLNDILKNSSDDPLQHPVEGHLHKLLDDHVNDHLNNSKEILNDHLDNPISEDFSVQLNLPSNDFYREDAPLTNPLALYNEIEGDEFADDMALHEPPVLQPPPPPPNAPTAQSTQQPLPDSTYLAPHAQMEEDYYLDSDEFEDSVDIQSMNLHGALADCEKAITYFFNNQLDSAIAIMTPWKETSLYHAHGAAIFEFIPAVLTLEPAQIQRAQDALRQTFTLCAQVRRSYTFVQSIGAIIKKPNYGGYTEEEAHAELVHAEALLLLACLGIIENEDMTGFLRASLRVRTSYNAYRMCAKILERKAWEDESSRAHFESGVRLGLATFNVMIAMLPPRIVTLLEFVGFSADKEKGKEELLKAAQSAGLRSVLCELTLLVYHLIIGHFAAIPPDFNAADKIISKSLKKYPDSVWFLMFKARTELLQGKVLDSIQTYQKTCRMKDLWPQMKHLAYWELVWAFAMLRQWTDAAEYAAFLERDSKWSRTIYMYAQAAMLVENGPRSPEERKCIDHLLMNASCYRQRLLGRSLPMEKFVLRRCERWSKRGYLVLPGIEWLYLWNIFPSLAAEQNHSDAILKIIERTGAKIKNSLDKKKCKALAQDTTETVEYDSDDLALAEFLWGSLLAAMALPRLALQHLEAVMAIKENIKENTFLVPYATVEIASCYYQFGDPSRAVELLQEARKKYSGYLLEARLHFRIHSKLEYIHAGIESREKPAEAASVTGADITARKAKPQPSVSVNEEADSSSSSNAKLELNSKTIARGSSSSISTPREPDSVNVEFDLRSNKGIQPRERFRATPEPDLSSNIRNVPDPNSSMTEPDLLASINSMPGSSLPSRMVTEPSPSITAEPMPSTSSASNFANPRSGCSTKLKTTAVLEPGTSATSPEDVSSTNGMPTRRSDKRDVTSTSFEMDLICNLAEQEPIAAASACVASEASNRRKGRT